MDIIFSKKKTRKKVIGRYLGLIHRGYSAVFIYNYTIEKNNIFKVSVI
jgi:hypothetical protein